MPTMIGNAAQPPADETLDALKTRLNAAVQSRRWQEATRGVPFSTATQSATMQSDATAQAQLTSAAKLGELYEQQNGAGTFSIDWQAVDGFITLTLNDIYNAGMTVGGHVQNCFSRQSQITAAIDGAADAAAAQSAYDTNIDTGWPA